jgi:hypothetical protein
MYKTHLSLLNQSIFNLILNIFCLCTLLHSRNKKMIVLQFSF